MQNFGIESSVPYDGDGVQGGGFELFWK